MMIEEKSMKNTVPVIFVMIVFMACSTVDNKKYLEISNQLRSENRLLQKRISLLQRENSVYKQENLQYKKNLDTKSAEMEKLESEKKSIREKFEKDIALWEKKYENLREKNLILEKESSEKIQELTELNRQLEEKLGGEIKRLAEESQKKDESFGKEREQLKKDFAQREFNHQKEIEEMRKRIAELERENGDMKMKISEFMLRVETAQKELEEKDARIRELEKTVSTLRKAMNGSTGNRNGRKDTGQKGNR